ncbi:MAG: hypothetical protein HY784_05165 [Chloroflexi bacterium]|nr:hypothetical protein [Chloroflexota bacterium]
MAIYTRRVQAILSEEQYKKLIHVARKQQLSISVLIRRAVEQVYLDNTDGQAQRRAALRDLLAMEAPVADWNTMEAGPFCRHSILSLLKMPASPSVYFKNTVRAELQRATACTQQ